MKYIITGAAGNISKPLAEQLLAAGHEVTVIGRNAENLKSLTDKGAKAAIGKLEDLEFLKNTFAGADAVYTMFPPQYAALDLSVYRDLALNYAEAIKENGIPYVVNLSSIGAHLPEGVGPVSGLYLVEQEFAKLSDVNVLHLRPGYFYTNFFGSLGMVANMNIIGNNSGDANGKIVLSHPGDIAEAATEELLSLSFKGQSIRYLVSDERTQGEVAKILGTAVGKPELPWIAFTDEESYNGMLGAGLPEEMAKKYVEMGSAMRSGKMFEDFLRNRPQTFGKIKLEDFAKDFAAAYNAG
ncbi:NAD(P)H-binding protein [Desertivirga arenae]|uniref:NAD(P)H-binding protein n=1 Tax=Desertivirga arenae TaxID=2810309 RepID=UPI001A95D304|nr:NAD(P)H-binding protein [Pedobacter sp. SYSU D00823]